MLFYVKRQKNLTCAMKSFSSHNYTEYEVLIDGGRDVAEEYILLYNLCIYVFITPNFISDIIEAALSH